MTITFIISIAVLGLLLGCIVGMTSIGKGLIGTPALILLGVDKFTAVGTVGIAGVFMMLSSAIKHYKYGNVHIKTVLVFSLTSMPLSWYFAAKKEAINDFISLKYIIAVAIILSVITLTYKFFLSKSGSSNYSQTPGKLVATAILGIALGFFIGATSISGSLIIIAFILFLKMPEKTAIGTTNFVAIFSLAAASVEHIVHGHVDWRLFAVFTPVVMAGAYFGAHLTHVIPQNPLRIIILSLLVVAASGMLKGEEMTDSLLLIISYVCIATSLAALIYKTAKMALMPPHLRWELAPVPHEKGKSNYGGSYLEEYEWWNKPRRRSLLTEAIYMFKEIVFLKGLWENNRRLWYCSFPFHFGMYLLICMILFVIVDVIGGLAGITNEGFFSPPIRALATAGFILATMGAMGLIVNRLIDPKLKKFNARGTFVNLFFLLAVFLSGIVSLIIVPDFTKEMTRFVEALFTVDTSVTLPGVICLHCLIGVVFLAYMPFTRMLHFAAKYFAYHEVRWNDAPMAENNRMAMNIQELLRQPVAWAAPHLKADGKKNWVDIATEGNKS